MNTIGTDGNQIRTMYVRETANTELDFEVNEVLMHQLKYHEIIDIKPIAISGEWVAALIVYKVIGV